MPSQSSEYNAAHNAVVQGQVVQGQVVARPSTYFRQTKYCKYLDHGRRCYAGCTPESFVCHAFYKGNCRRGANCKYLHSQLSLAEPQSKRPRSVSVGIRHGNAVWNNFWSPLQHADTLGIFDKHHVLDTMWFDEAAYVGVELDHIEGMAGITCSRGRKWRQQLFAPDAPWAPMVAECEGYVFTDYPVGYHRDVDVYREDWMAENCIGVRGDKGQVASLLRRPCILFDDREDNVQQLLDRSTSLLPLEGIVVRRGRRRNDWVDQGYFWSTDCLEWPGLLRDFNQRFGQTQTWSSRSGEEEEEEFLAHRASRR